jgi:hypothetical protein
MPKGGNESQCPIFWATVDDHTERWGLESWLDLADMFSTGLFINDQWEASK